MDRKSVLGIVLVFLGIVVFLGLYGFSIDQPGQPALKTGEWNMVFSETISTDSPEVYVTESYDVDSDVEVLNLKWIEKKMFSGEYDGVPIVGGLVGNDISFEVNDKSKGLFVSVDGTFSGSLLILNIIRFADESMSHIKEGIFAKYVRGDASLDRELKPMLDLMELNPTKGEGKYHYISHDGALVGDDYDPMDVVVVSQGQNIAVVDCNIASNPLIPGDSIRLVCIFNENKNGGSILTVYGSSDNQMFSGKMSIGGNKMTYFLHGADGNQMALTSVTYDVVYPQGDYLGPTDISGKWVGNVYYSHGNTIEDGEVLIVKDVIYVDPCFGCVEVSDYETFNWIGTSNGNLLYALAEHMGRHYSLFGEVNGHMMYLCGYYLDEFDKYRSVYYELTLQT